LLFEALVRPGAFLFWEEPHLREERTLRLGALGRALIPVVLLAAPAFAILRDADAGPRAFELTASRFKFEPAVLQVTEGDTVRITARSVDSVHGLAIKELKVKLAIPKGGAPATVEFTASKAGTFTIECSEYCGPGHRDMRGKLVVAPRSAQ
jgi:cytochrome c oxidase subunit 2